MLRCIGEAIAMMHDGGLVHGDLTTSNLMVRSDDNALVRCDGAEVRMKVWTHAAPSFW